MNKIFGMVMVFMLMAVSAMAVSAVSVPMVQIHAVDNNGHDLSGVVVAPEFKGLIFGWNDMLPKQMTTDANGMASASTWDVLSGRQIQVNYATLAGYTCTRGDSTRMTSQHGMNTLTTVCTPEYEVPEFGVIAAGVALIGAAGMIFFARRN